MVGGFHGMLLLICEMCKINCLMGRHFMRGGSEYHPGYKDLSRLHQFGSKVLPGIFLGYELHAGGIWKGDLLVADIEELEQMDASTSRKGEKFIFPIADGTVKISGGDPVLRTSTSIQDRPERGEEQSNLVGESDGSSSTPFHDSSLYEGEARNDFWSISGTFIYRHHVEASSQTVRADWRILPYSTEIHWRYQSYKYIIGCNCGENIDDNWNVDEIENCQIRGQVSQGSRCWMKKHRVDIHSPGRDWRESKRHPDLTLCGLRFGKKSQKRRSEEKSKSGLSKKINLENARKLLGIYFIDPADEEFNETLKMRVESWKFQCQQQCLARSGDKSTRKFVALLVPARQNTHASLKPTNLREIVWQELYTKIMKIMLQGQK